MPDSIICFINRYCRNTYDVQEQKDSALLQDQKEQTTQSIWWATGSVSRKKAENSEQSGCSRDTTKSYIY